MAFRNRSTRTPKTLNEAYVEAVVDFCADEFDFDDSTRGILVRTLWGTTVDKIKNPNGPWEFVLDNPSAANWRLKIDRSTGAFRVADYHMSNSPERTERVARCDAVLLRLYDQYQKGSR